MSAMSRRVFLLGGVSFFPCLYLESLLIGVRRYRVPVRNLPPAFEGFTILHLSDLHDKPFGPGGAELIEQIREERVDMVALTGDLVVGQRPQLTPALELVAGLNRQFGCPVYSVCGNHDWGLGRAPEFNEALRGLGVRVLTNSAQPLERGGARIWIVGVDDPVTGRDDLERALAGTGLELPRLLLVHSPQLFPAGLAKGLDLMLAGHTHGGQLRMPLLGALYVPGLGFLPHYDYGIYRAGASTMIVSGGLGESGLPFRFNMRPELSLVTLTDARRSPPPG